MGGEMVFIHRDKPISNLADYEKLVQDIVNDCKNQVVPVEFSLDRATEVLSEKEKHDEKKYIGADNDYIVGITLQKQFTVGCYHGPNLYLRVLPEHKWDAYRYAHFYILFPKDPNTFKVVSKMHARGFYEHPSGWDIKYWIANFLTKFEKTFDGVFELYYGDGFSGFSGDES